MAIDRLFTAGGAVMWPLLGFSVVGTALIVERVRFWYRVMKRQAPVIKQALRFYQLENLVGTIELLKQNADLPLPRIFLAALELEDPNPEEFRLALESEAQAEIPNLKRFNNFFDTIISLSPLFGLLGTVLGLITSFASLKVGDVGGSKTAGVTSGISEALVSTASGLVVAIFIMMFANTFRGFYLRQIALIQEYCGQLELLYRHRYERKERSYASTR
ncbi:MULTISPECIES: MotA/TolQ/ExbB proton channel family protein [Kamptonema]|uniref:MotA/TolQ/ExbB proton channel family protein n=1 Tax=Kamptonema TaxID=1501433 RepID=UPI0001DAC408|nr:MULTISPECIES: MotA/TolQ/ExbB proton channel family protein [Kamptonema]CBN56081.1 biopolymer transport protein [Kamptonema sp. PCC 6506]